MAGIAMDPLLGTVVGGAFRVLSTVSAQTANLKLSKKGIFTVSGLACVPELHQV
jgi:hypothetical protein